MGQGDVPCNGETQAVTADQEPAWKTYVKAIEAKREVITEHRDALRDGVLDREAFLQQRTAGWEAHQAILQARDTLAKALTVKQRYVLDRAIGAPCINGNVPVAYAE